MFGRKQQPDQPTQNQSISGGSINNAQVQLTQAGRDASAQQAGTLGQQQPGITGAEVVKLLEALAAAVQASPIAPEVQQKITPSIGAATAEAKREDVDKELVAKNLRRAQETLESLSQTSDAGKNLWQQGQEVFGAIAPWLGVAAKFLGL